MGLFDNRTDTEKEIERYQQQKNNNSSSRQRSPFDVSNDNIQNNYPSTNINNQSANYYSNNKNKPSNTSKKSTIIGTVFLIWFISSIIGMIALAPVSTDWGIIIFGQIFFVFGIIAICKTKRKLENALLFIFPLVGLGCIAAGVITLCDINMDIFDGKILPIMFLGLFFVVGLIITVIPIYTRKSKEKRCKVLVIATVVEIKRKHSSGKHHRYVYAPVYEFFLNGRLCREQEGTYTNVLVPSLGDKIEMYVNSEDPGDFYVKNDRKIFMFIFMGVFFMIMSLPAILLLIFS